MWTVLYCASGLLVISLDLGFYFFQKLMQLCEKMASESSSSDWKKSRISAIVGEDGSPEFHRRRSPKCFYGLSGVECTSWTAMNSGRQFFGCLHYKISY